MKKYLTPIAQLLYLKSEDIMIVSDDDLIEDNFDPAESDQEWN